MRLLLAAMLLMLCLPPAFSLEASKGMPAEEDVTVDFRNGTYYANLNFRVPVPSQLALEVLTDFDHMAKFVPNLTASKLLERSGNVFRIAQQGKADFGPFSFAFESERRVELFPEGRLVSQALSGTARYMQSELRVETAGAGSRIDYRIEMLPDRWLPSVIGVSFMRHELAEQFTALAREMMRRQKLRQGH